MGSKISARQAALFTVINYIGVGIGIISTVIIYPQDKELLGIVRFLDACAQIMFPIMVLGSTHALINFYPALSSALQRKLFSFSLLSITKIAILLGGMIFIGQYFFRSDQVGYIWMALPLALSMAFIELFRRQATNLQKLAVPTFFEKIIPKLALPIAFLLVIFLSLSYSKALWFYICCYIGITFFIGLYIYKNFRFRLHWDFSDLFTRISKKKYYNYSLYAFAGSFGSFFAFRIDSLMIPQFVSFEANGTYNIGVTLASTLGIPAMGIFALYAPVISEFVKTGSWKELNQKYREVAKILFFVGMSLFACVVVGIEPLFKMLPTYENLAPSIPVIFVLGLNMVINMSTSFNSEIISYSKYYRFNLVAISTLMLLNITLNWVLLTQTNLGIMGVAYASFLSLTLFNSAKLIYIRRKMKLWPFDIQFLQMVLFFGSVLGILYLLPSSGYLFFDLIAKVGLVLVFNCGVAYMKGWVPSFNVWVQKVLYRLKG